MLTTAIVSLSGSYAPSSTPGAGTNSGPAPDCRVNARLTTTGAMLRAADFATAQGVVGRCGRVGRGLAVPLWVARERLEQHAARGEAPRPARVTACQVLDAMCNAPVANDPGSSFRQQPAAVAPACRHARSTPKSAHGWQVPLTARKLLSHCAHTVCEPLTQSVQLATLHPGGGEAGVRCVFGQLMARTEGLALPPLPSLEPPLKRLAARTDVRRRDKDDHGRAGVVAGLVGGRPCQRHLWRAVG